MDCLLKACDLIFQFKIAFLTFHSDLLTLKSQYKRFDISCNAKRLIMVPSMHWPACVIKYVSSKIMMLCCKIMGYFKIHVIIDVHKKFAT